MIRSNNNLTTVVLSDVTKLTSALPAVGALVTSANLEKGAVVVTDLGLRRLNAAAYAALASTAKIFIVQGKGANKPLLKTPVLTKGSLEITYSKHKATKNQITIHGYNGTTGSLPVANDTSFFIKVRKNDNDAANRSQPTSLYAQAKTDTSGTQEELAYALVGNGVKNFSKEPANGYINIDALCNGSTTANTGAGTITVAYGSRNVTFGTDVDAVAVIGDYIRFDESAGAAPGTSDTVYKILAMDSTNQIMTLDRPFTSASLSAVAEGNAVIIANADAITADFGIRISGIQANFDVNKFRDFYANRFTSTFSDESTLNTHLQGAYNGNGVWQQVAMDEYMTYGFEGQNEMLGVPPTARDQEVKIPGVGSYVLADCKYSPVQINWTEDIRGLVTTAGAEGSVLIYLNLTQAGSLSATSNTGSELATVLGLTPANLNE